MTPLHELSATELVAAYRERRLSPLEVARAVVAHLERWEPHIRATWGFDAEAALAQAHHSEVRWQRGEPCGALDGVPVTIKENIATRGVPVPLGSAATELVPATEDAPPAARLREALALWRGPLPAELLDAPLAGLEVRRLEELRLSALEDRIGADLAAGRHAEVVPELESLTAENPLRERLWAQYMV
ncbi:MAG: hypothetical protein IH627_11000, partial [Rubrivivax sp.]|nr:hypothetical protein [Rubrivivax sp.]